MSDVPMPPKEWLAELTAATDKAAAGYGWQAGYAAALSVRDAELDRLSQENDRLAAELKDLRSSVRTIADRLTDWCHDDTASKTIAGSIAGDLNALAETKDGHR